MFFIRVLFCRYIRKNIVVLPQKDYILRISFSYNIDCLRIQITGNKISHSLHFWHSRCYSQDISPTLTDRLNFLLGVKVFTPPLLQSYSPQIHSAEFWFIWWNVSHVFCWFFAIFDFAFSMLLHNVGNTPDRLALHNQYLRFAT